ncbi:proline--tRNA ligase [Candidatus Tremblaya phenacola]|uniref:proline--tRNA ligase n=1 Tax=Candidatus Tremblayella phenacoccinincola TaxID=1010676 RepID=UPI0013306E43|nr:proline--tRNA ligase [Candidatus Tremblaya phenacola]KAH0998191.1 Prolyl-tRNA synthetase, bacterial type [Candidatus Tremblaya phenacola]
MARTSKYLLCTLRKSFSDTDIISNKLMLRAGMIRKLASGIFTWLPIGLRVMNKLNNVIRKEMLKVGCIEILMPSIHPINIWERSGRLKDFSSELIKLTDRNKKEFVLGPTHEEVVTELVNNEIHSHKQLPLAFYQVQAHFRDEIRPRFGVVRSKEFLMKDAYSFHITQKNLKATYSLMSSSYCSIFKRIGLKYKIKKASSGVMGDGCSHEFHALGKDGENDIIFTTKPNYASNIDLSETLPSFKIKPMTTKELKLVVTTKIKSAFELATYFNVSIYKTIKAFIVHTNKLSNPFLVLIIRGDHQLNKIKLGKNPDIQLPLKYANIEELKKLKLVNVDSPSSTYEIGLFSLSMSLIIDRSVAVMDDFIASANIKSRFFYGVNWGRDLLLPKIADIRIIDNGVLWFKKKSILKRNKSIEIGHIFQVGTKYSDIINNKLHVNEDYKQSLIMGCYGIGISRTIAAIIEQNYDKAGIIWSKTIAPFQVAIIALNMHRIEKIKELAEHLYNKLASYNIDVLLDDRVVSLGVMFNDIELIGINHIILITNNILLDNVEYKNRFSGDIKVVNINAISSYILKELMLNIG